jgi:hypothetical protein
MRCRWPDSGRVMSTPGYASGCGAGPSLFEQVERVAYVGLQQLLDEANAWGRYCYEKATCLDELTDEAIAVVAEEIPGKTSPLSYRS